MVALLDFLKLASFQFAVVPTRLQELQTNGGRGRNASDGTASELHFCIIQKMDLMTQPYIPMLTGIQECKNPLLYLIVIAANSHYINIIKKKTMFLISSVFCSSLQKHVQCWTYCVNAFMMSTYANSHTSCNIS